MDFNNKTLLITGGTGSFGNAVLERFLDSNLKEIRIFSRDEKKQDDMRKKYTSEKLRFYIGDVRDYSSLKAAMHSVDFLFHAAALKQVPSCEFYPLEAVKTNVFGTDNVIEAGFEYGVKKIVCLSTDKAVYPINAMGTSKAMMEKVAVAKSRTAPKGVFVSVTRYGNVMASRGSVIPLFVNQLLNNLPITVTDPEMTRFMMTLDDAVNLVKYAFDNGNNGDIFVQKSPAATINTLLEAILETFDKKNHEVRVIGTRHGEKLYEALCSQEEMLVAQDEGEYYRICADNRDLNYEKFFDKGSKDVSKVDDYNSHNTKRLNINEMKNLLLKLDFINEALNI